MHRCMDIYPCPEWPVVNIRWLLSLFTWCLSYGLSLNLDLTYSAGCMVKHLRPASEYCWKTVPYPGFVCVLSIWAQVFTVSEQICCSLNYTTFQLEKSKILVQLWFSSSVVMEIFGSFYVKILRNIGVRSWL